MLMKFQRVLADHTLIPKTHTLEFKSRSGTTAPEDMDPGSTAGVCPNATQPWGGLTQHYSADAPIRVQNLHP